jgi:hypothetical protein
MAKKNIQPILLKSLACLSLVLLAACTSSTYSGDDIVVGETSSQARPLTVIPSHLGEPIRDGVWVLGARRGPQQPAHWLPPPS